MPIERISLNFDIDRSGSLVIVYGNVIQEEFLFSDLVYRNIEQALWKYCKENGFERVILFDTKNSIHFFDTTSRDLFTKVEAIPNNTVEPQESFGKKYGELFGKNPLSKKKETKEEIQSPQVVVPVRGGELHTSSNGIFHIKRLTDADAFGQLDSCMRESQIKTAIILSKHDIRTIANQGQGSLLNTIQEWSNLPHTNPNKCFFVINSHKLEDLQDNISNTPILNTIIEQSKENRGMQSVLHITHPKKDEIKRLLQRHRLVKSQIKTEWKQVEAITRVLIGEMKPLKHWALSMNQIDELSFVSVKKITTNKSGDYSDKSALQRLLDLTGLDDVKRKVLKQVHLIKASKTNPNLIDNSRLHLVFKGSPGTGKTTIARLISEIYQEEGILSNGHLIEGDRKNLVAEYEGQTAIKTSGVCNDAKGGVLFIDEAYSLKREGNDPYGLEAVETLMKIMEDSRKDLCVILAGYPDKMNKLIESNPGFKRRIGAELIFEDYTPDQLFQIAIPKIKKTGLTFSDGLIEQIKIVLTSMFNRKDEHFGNAGAVEQFIQEIIDEHIIHCAEKHLDFSKEIVDIHCIPANFKIHLQTQSDEITIESALQGLNEKVGLDFVKGFVQSMITNIQADKIKLERGLLNESNVPSLHMIFSGNPGTGKTSVARDFGKIFKALGILRKGHVVEIQGEDLVAGYRGQTAEQAATIINSALDGVLFIDEAYGLVGDSSSDSDFFKTAQNKLLKLMEDNKERLVVIAAGYPDEMQAFIKSNQGFNRRFPYRILFENNNAEELTEIVETLCKREKYILSDEAKKSVTQYFEILIQNTNPRDFGNAGETGNFFELIKSNQNKRIILNLEISDTDLMTIVEGDIPSINLS